MKTFFNIMMIFLMILAVFLFVFIKPFFIAKDDNVDNGDSEFAAHILETTGINKGVCSILDCKNDKTVIEIIRASTFFVHIQDTSDSLVAKTKRIMDEANLYGKRVVVEKGSKNKLPYADNSIDLVISVHLNDSELEELSLSEILRVLRPKGKAILGRKKMYGKHLDELTSKHLLHWLKANNVEQYKISKDKFGLWARVTKPPEKGIDNWSHWVHSPDNNPVSRDTVIKAPYMTQWIGEPLYPSMPSITVAAGGRTFLAMGHIAHHEREEKWLNTLYARNGYNGTLLWTHKLPDGYLAHRSAFIATDSIFYMIDIDGTGCLLLDPETGVEIDRIHIPGYMDEWKWIAIENDMLFALLGNNNDPAQTTVVRSQSPHWHWGNLSKGYYDKRIPWGFGTTILAYNLNKKKVVWTHKEKAPIDSRAMVIGDGKLFFYCPDSHIGSISNKSGELIWKNGDPGICELIENFAIGKAFKQTGIRTTGYCLYTPEVLIYGAQAKLNVVAVSTKDGSLLWTRRKSLSPVNMLYADNHIIAPIGYRGNVLELDPLTGETIRDLGFNKRACARITATWDSFFFRGWPDGLGRYDRITEKVFLNPGIRPSCTDGVLPANGLLYVGPWACDCNLSLIGIGALCSAGDFKFDFEAKDKERLETGDGDIYNVIPLELSEKDWPTYRANNDHNASSKTSLSLEVDKIWEFKPRSENIPTSPTAAGSLIFIGGDDCKVRAIDAATGILKWSYLTAGPIKQPPTIWNNRAYVGSSDGYVYAFEAVTGRLLWRFRVSPVERRIMVYGSLSSTWPVNTGVLVKDGVVYTAAGMIDYDGTYVYALDGITGKIEFQNNTSGHLNKEMRKGVSAQGTLTIANGRLWMAGGNVVSPAEYDLATGKCLSYPPNFPNPGYNRGQEIGIFNKQYIIVGGRLRYSPTENSVNNGTFFAYQCLPKKGTGNPIPFNMGQISPAWDENILVCLEGRYTVPVCYKTSKFEEYLNKYKSKGMQSGGGFISWYNSGAHTGFPKPVWKAHELKECDVVSLAIAKNAIVTVYKYSGSYTERNDVFKGFLSDNLRWTVCALDPNDGSVIWKYELSKVELLAGRPHVKDFPVLPGGLLIDRNGRIIVVLQNGTIICLGNNNISK